MTWLEDLARELGSAGVTRRHRRRILLELRDHIECDPGCEEQRLGDPRELAARFADELATHWARRCAWYVFGALATAAFALVPSLAAVGHGASGYPGYASGLSAALFAPAAIGMLVAPQIAFVAGTLAAVRAARRRRARVMPAAEIALIRRRAWVGVGAGFATVAGLALYVVNFSSVLPLRWLALTAGLTAVSAAALLAASTALLRSGTLRSSVSGDAGDVYDDVPELHLGWLRRCPWLLGAVGSLGAPFAVAVVTGRAERSVFEGLQRGVFEGLAVVVGFVLLGRLLGLVPAARDLAYQLEGAGFADARAEDPDRLVADADRSHAEQNLRDSYAEGRLSLQELITRVGAVHEARSVDDLRAALSGLPDG